MTHWTTKYIGIPFADAGSTRDGCNCWGLVCLVLSEQRGIEVPTYGEITARDLVAAARAMGRDGLKTPWTRVTEPKAFDVALMYAMTPTNARVVGHAGIMSSPTDLLHVWRKTDAVNMAIDHPRIRHRIVGFYRHAALTEGCARGV